MMKFFPDQIALCPRDPERAIALLTKLGMTEWARDLVTARGVVFGQPMRNTAALAFNYQALEGHARELEVLHYTDGPNWMRAALEPRVSHLGMHVTDAELAQWRVFFASEGIVVAQEVVTTQHTNPYLIDNPRHYNYVIFDTHEILGVDLKFIVRIPGAPQP